MSLLARFFGGGSTLDTQGGHNIQKESALAKTTPNAISPSSPPDWNKTNVRTAPVLTQYRPISWAEAEALTTQATARETQSRNFDTALKALEKIETSDEKDHGRLRRYQGHVAAKELGKLKSNAALAEKLHQMRPGYAALSHQIESAEIQASRQITELRNKYTALMY